jgi:hypothetical protein
VISEKATVSRTSAVIPIGLSDPNRLAIWDDAWDEVEDAGENVARGGEVVGTRVARGTSRVDTTTKPYHAWAAGAIAAGGCGAVSGGTAAVAYGTAVSVTWKSLQDPGTAR